MEPLEVYDYLAATRARVLDRVRALDGDAYTRSFPIGPGTLGKILTHIMISEWYYVQRMLEHEVPPYASWPIQDEDPPPLATLEHAWGEQVQHTRAALTSITDWATDLEYRVTNDEGQEQIVTASPADLFTQLVLHEVHHRAQTLNILRQLGVPPDDLDFNAFFPRRDASS